MIFALAIMGGVVAVLLWALMRADREYWALYKANYRMRGENDALRRRTTEEKSENGKVDG